MSIPGPKPKPPALRLLEGNPGKRPVPTDTAATAVKLEAPPEPDWSELLPGRKAEAKRLRRDAAAAWANTVPELERLGLLARVDEAVLVDYAVCRARILELERDLARNGMTLPVEKVGRDGASYTDLIRNPASVSLPAYRNQLKAYIGELGLSPSARGRLTVKAEAAADDELFD